MIKFVVLAKGPKEWTKEQFIEWWRGPHAESAKKLPGLMAYNHGVVLQDFDQPNGEPQWDGIAQLYFENEEALQKMLKSEEWKKATQETANMGGRRIALITDEVDLLNK